MKEDDLEKATETDFEDNMEIYMPIGLTGESEANYAYAVSEAEWMITFFRLTCIRRPHNEFLYILFTDEQKSLFIYGTPENVFGVLKPTGIKEWMGTTVIPKRLSEDRGISTIFWKFRRILYVENCSGQVNKSLINRPQTASMRT